MRRHTTIGSGRRGGGAGLQRIGGGAEGGHGAEGDRTAGAGGAEQDGGLSANAAVPGGEGRHHHRRGADLWPEDPAGRQCRSARPPPRSDAGRRRVGSEEPPPLSTTARPSRCSARAQATTRRWPPRPPSSSCWMWWRNATAWSSRWPTCSTGAPPRAASATSGRRPAWGAVRWPECPATTTPTARPDVDWQIWIEQGTSPLPRKLLITSIKEPGQPQYTAVMNWTLSPLLDDELFAFVPPKNAQPITLAPLGGTGAGPTRQGRPPAATSRPARTP